MERDPALDEISEKIRHGEAVGFFEAIAAIEYQKALQKHAAENHWLARLKRWFRAADQRQEG